MRTQVCIIGAGPAGLLLSQLLHTEGIESIVLERRFRAHVEGRIRAGVLEDTTMAALERAQLGGRASREALRHDGFTLGFDDDGFRVDLHAATGRSIFVYGQTEIVADLLAAHDARAVPPLFEVEDGALHDIGSARPSVSFRHQGQVKRIDCDFVAGCDGFHGVSRSAIPADVLRTYEKIYPFGWLGVLADVPPCHHELIYANHANGFALASMRSPTRSRYYLQVPQDEDVAAWSDARFWDETSVRLGALAPQLTRGPALEKSIAPLRSFVAEPMRYGRLFLAGDAAHIVPPTGAKGLNLAVSDATLLADALIGHYRENSDAGLDAYSTLALARVWKAVRFSWWFTGLMHRMDDDPITRKLQSAELNDIRNSAAAQASLAENYVGIRT